MNARTRAIRVAVTVAWMVTLSTDGLRTQNPAVDLPHRRMLVAADASTDAFLQHGLAELQAGARWDAARAFREVVVRNPARAVGLVGLALATRAHPRRANAFAWDAYRVREDQSAAERLVIEAYARCLGAERAPNPADATLDDTPSAERLAALRDTLATAAPTNPLAARLLAIEAGAGTEPARSLGALLAANRERLARDAAMPFLIAGLPDALDRLARTDGVDDSMRAMLARLPRHPCFAPTADGAGDAASPEMVDALRWDPPTAPGYDLPRGLGGRDSLEAHRGTPTLVVFFLGFGCVHCIEQLHDLAPHEAEFRAAGIRIVAIGTDTEDQVKASYQMARENGDTPLPFDMLCDPDAKSFRAWGAFDEFEQKPLHGTFLVDAAGRILWQDISIEPFMDTAFLLAESERLLAAWR